MSTLHQKLLHLIPGVLLLVGVAVVAATLAPRLWGLNSLLLAIGIGTLIANTLSVPNLVRPGLALHTLLLELGIVFLGAQISIADVRATGLVVVLLSLFTVALSLLYVEFLSRSVFDITTKTGSLLAAGVSICGVSAVLAVAGSIDADEHDVIYAIATILLFDAVTIVVFPLVGNVLGLSDAVFGVWAGLSMFSTGPVAAAGFAHSEVAGEWATVTKLVRNSLIGLVALAYSVYYLRASHGAGDSSVNLRALLEGFPKFLVGFLVVVIAANLGVFSTAQLALLETGTNWLFLLAFAGFGFSINLRTFRHAGLTPVLVVLAHLVTVSTVVLVVVSIML